MSRRKASDRRVREILAAFDYVTAMPDLASSDLCAFMFSVADTGCDRFRVPGGWLPNGIRAVLMAFVLHAPAADLDDMVKKARKELRWFKAWQAREKEAA